MNYEQILQPGQPWIMASFADCVIEKFSGTPVCAIPTITPSNTIPFNVLPTPYTVHTACPTRRRSVTCCALFKHLSLWPGYFVSCLQPPKGLLSGQPD